MTDKAVSAAAYEAGYHDAIEELFKAISVDLAMCELANSEDADSAWLSGFWFAQKRVIEVTKDFMDREEDEGDD